MEALFTPIGGGAFAQGEAFSVLVKKLTLDLNSPAELKTSLGRLFIDLSFFLNDQAQRGEANLALDNAGLTLLNGLYEGLSELELRADMASGRFHRDVEQALANETAAN